MSETIFLRLLETEDKAAGLLELARQADSRVFLADTAAFVRVPGSPFAYWIDEPIRSLFARLPSLEGDGRTAKQGIATADDFRFVRTRWEVAESGRANRWLPFAKGGRYSPYYADIHLIVNWAEDGKEICNFRKLGSDRIASRPQNLEFMRLPGLTWSDRTTKRFSARAWQAGGVFSVKGSAGFFPGSELFALAVLNSSAFSFLLSLLVGAGDAAARSYQVGTIGAIPWPPYDPRLDEYVLSAIKMKRSIDTSDETSSAFLFPQSLLNERPSAGDESVESCLARIQQKIDALVFELYGLSDDHRAAIERNLASSSEAMGEANADEKSDDSDDPIDEPGWQNTSANVLVSWAIGVAFGRFDLRLATGARPINANISHPKALSA